MHWHLYLGCVYFDKRKGGPDRGSWRCIVEDEDERVVLLAWRRTQRVTANQTAMRGILEVAQAVRQEAPEVEKLVVHTCFQYLTHGYNIWSAYWLENNFQSKVSGAEIRNRDLWEKLLSYRGWLEVKWHLKNVHPKINAAMDFCWQVFDDPNFPGDVPEGIHWFKPNRSV